MKQTAMIAAFICAISLSASVFAQNPQGPRSAGRPHGGGKMHRMDVNNDGAISRDEWKGKPGRFDRIDRNHDNTITRDEAMSSARNRGRQRLREMDANNDHQISRDEWKGDAELFGRLDANNDGVITREEMRRRRRNQ